MVCPEVRRLRTFECTGEAGMATVGKLTKKYKQGRRSAREVVQGLDALVARNETELVRLLATTGLLAVTPVPTVLWVWVCDHARLMGANTLRHVIEVAAVDARCARHLLPRAAALTATPEGLVALAHAAHKLPWGPELARPAIAAYLELWPR